MFVATIQNVVALMVRMSDFCTAGLDGCHFEICVVAQTDSRRSVTAGARGRSRIS